MHSWQNAFPAISSYKMHPVRLHGLMQRSLISCMNLCTVVCYLSPAYAAILQLISILLHRIRLIQQLELPQRLWIRRAMKINEVLFVHIYD